MPDAPQVARVVSLPGGLTNSNFRFEFDGRLPVEAKLYQGARNLAPVERAVHRLGTQHGLPVPRLLDGGDANPVTGTPYALFEWIGGGRLDLALRGLEAEAVRALARKAGAALAKVHGVTFERLGFFDAALQVQGPIDLGGTGMRAYFADVLTKGIVRERLGAACADALVDFAARESGILDSWQGAPCLAHGDCGGTNILVTGQGPDWSITGIIDWEFAFSGTPFFDLGNLLRAPIGGLPGFAEGLAEGYRNAGGILPENWRSLAAMTDLLAWVESASRPRVSDEFLDSARQAIARTIGEWNPHPEERT